MKHYQQKIVGRANSLCSVLFMVENKWFPSGPPPSASTPGGSPLRLPPDPSDGPLSLAQFPPLSPILHLQQSRSVAQTAPSLEPVSSTFSAAGVNPATTDVVMAQMNIQLSNTQSEETVNPRSAGTVQDSFTVFPPKGSSPLLTNNATASATPSATMVVSDSEDSVIPSPVQTVFASAPNSGPPDETPTEAPKLVDRIRKSMNRTLQRLSPPVYTENEKVHLSIPEEVYQRGAEAHRDFIVCYFSGRIPAFKQIQSVLNHLWGKGRGLEIHTNHLTNSMLVRIPNDFIRQKVLEKKIWYVGDSMLHALQWPSPHKDVSTAFSSFPIWAHLKDVPLDLRTLEGLSWVAGALGEPKETDDYTLNLTSLVMSHVKVEMDFSRQLPKFIEIPRASGEVVLVEVTFPWLPSLCTHCKQMGHSLRNCHLLPKPTYAKDGDLSNKNNSTNQATGKASRKGNETNSKKNLSESTSTDDIEGPPESVQVVAKPQGKEPIGSKALHEESIGNSIISMDTTDGSPGLSEASTATLVSTVASSGLSEGLTDHSKNSDDSSQRESPLVDARETLKSVLDDCMASVAVDSSHQVVVPQDNIGSLSSPIEVSSTSEPLSPSSCTPSSGDMMISEAPSPGSVGSDEDYPVAYIVGLPAQDNLAPPVIQQEQSLGKRSNTTPKKYMAKPPLHSARGKTAMLPLSPIKQVPTQVGSSLASLPVLSPNESAISFGTISGCLNRPSSHDRDGSPPS